MSGIIKVEHKGDLSKTLTFLNRNKNMNIRAILDKYGKAGVRALKSATPKDTGKTSNSWKYTIERGEMGANTYTITWRNTNENKGQVIALLIQYGHGTATGGYIQGKDYINPAMKNVFDNCCKEVWKEVNK